MKKLFAFILASTMLISNASLVFASDTEETTNNSIHTMTIEKTAPLRDSDSFAWMITSEPGQLAESINALGLGNLRTDFFDKEDTVVYFTQDRLNPEEICNKFNLNYGVLTTDDFPLTITYIQTDTENFDFTNKSTVKITEESSNISPRTTGTFNDTLENNTVKTTYQTKDDNEQTAYLTFTKMEPRNYPNFLGVYARVRAYTNDNVMTALASFFSPDAYTIPYRYDGESGKKYYMEFANGSSERDVDIAGRWTP